MNRLILTRLGNGVGRLLVWFIATFAFSLAGFMAMDQYPPIHDALMLTEIGPTCIFEIVIVAALVWAIVPILDAVRLGYIEVTTRD